MIAGRRIALVAALVCVATAAAADAVLDAIDAARSAYQAGNIQTTLDELASAQQLVREMKTAGLSAFLPEAQAGWTRSVDTDSGAGRAIFGGGVGARARYVREGAEFTVTLMSDNAVVQALAGLLGDIDAAVTGDTTLIGGQAFLEQSGELTGLVGKRIIVQAAGAPVEAMRPVLEKIDYAALAQFAQ